MYKTLNKVFHAKKKHGKAAVEDTDGKDNVPGSPGPGLEPRPDSPLRLGSPSVAAIGEATLKKVVKRLFYPDGFAAFLADGAQGAGGRSKEVPTEMLAFEIGSIFRRMLEIHDSMSEKMLSSLRSNLQAPGVVTLISNDLRVLWGLAGYEKQQELGLVASRVAVLGRKCNDLRLRKLRVLFSDLDSPSASFKDYSVSPAEADIIVRFMREQSEATDALKSEMESIQLLHTRIQEYGEWNSLQEMVTQGKLVEKLQGHCLWAYNLDYLVQLLVIAICSLRKRIFGSFGHCACPDAVRESSLGESGLALHYANVVVLLERIIQQPDAVLGPTRDELYDMLPRNIQYLLRVQLQDPLNFTTDGRVEANLKRGLLLLPTMAHNTIHWHSRHTPGAALDSSEVVFQVQTFYYANRTAVNAALVDVLLGLCRICGVENPIGFISVQSPATADQSQAIAKNKEEDEKHFRKLAGLEDREEDPWGGQVFKIEEPKEERTRKKDTGRGGPLGSSTEANFLAAAMAELAASEPSEGTPNRSEKEREKEEGREVVAVAGTEIQEESEEVETRAAGSNPGMPPIPSFKRAHSARMSEDFTKLVGPSALAEDKAGAGAGVGAGGSSSARLSSSKSSRVPEVSAAASKLTRPQRKSVSAKWGSSGSGARGQSRGIAWSGPWGGPADAALDQEEDGLSSAALRSQSLRRVLPSSGLTSCFVPSAGAVDSDSESEGGEPKFGTPKPPRVRRGNSGMRSRQKDMSQEFEVGKKIATPVRPRKTKHYHSQPLPQPQKNDL